MPEIHSQGGGKENGFCKCRKFVPSKRKSRNMRKAERNSTRRGHAFIYYIRSEDEFHPRQEPLIRLTGKKGY